MRRMALLPLLIVAALFTAPTAFGTASAAPPPAPSFNIGMDGGGPLMWLPDDQLAKDLDAARNSGAAWIRVDVDWSAIEATKGRLQWANTDRVVDAARSRGLHVLGLTTYTPRWAQDQSVPAGTTHGRPASAAAFGNFAGQAANHFAGRVSNWEIWNEPNLDVFFAPRVDSAIYTSMLRASATAIRAAVPGATVLSGGLAPAVDGADLSSVSPVTFLRQMYANGAANSMDAIAVHPYSFPALPSDATTANWNTFYRLRLMHDTMVSNGDDNKRMWLTEFGAPTGSGRTAVSEQQQAAIIADGLSSARSLGYVGPVFVYDIRDSNTGSSDIEQNFGLLRSDRTVKPAYGAVQQQAAKDAGAPTTDPPAVSPTPSVPAPDLNMSDWWSWLLSLFQNWFHVLLGG